MAPEQIRGQEADGRADVFALGAILLELLTGRRAFQRESRIDTLHASLHEDPPLLSGLSEQLPALGRIVQRCLEKDPEARFQSAGDLAFALESTSGSALPALHVDDRPRARRRVIPIVAAAVLLLAGVAGLAVWWRASTAPRPTQGLARFTLPLPPRMRFANAPAISPDGTTIVFRAFEGPIETQRLFVRRLDQLTTAVLPGTEGGSSPFFSPDGTSVAFWADNKLKRTSLDTTASPVVICHVELFQGGTWMPNGTIVFGSNNRGLQQVAAAGGSPQPLATVDPARSEIDHHAPEVLPGGRALLMTVHEGEARFRIDVLIFATGARRTVIAEGFDAQYVSTGHLVYAQEGALIAVPFALERLDVSGPAVRLFDGVAFDHDGVGHYALSDTGTLVFSPRAPAARRTLAWVDRDGGTTSLPLEPRPYWTPRLSPDGGQFAVVVRDDVTSHIWVQRFDRATFSRVTQQGQNWAPVWSLDGSQLIYASHRDGRSHLVRQPADGSGPPEILLSTEAHEVVPGTLTLDGRSLIYVQRSPTGDAELRALDLSSRQTEALDDLPVRVGMPARSPDGRWLGFTAWTPLRPSVFIRPLGRQGPARLLVEAAGYTVWNRTGDRLFFRSRRGSTEGSSDGIFELPFDPIRSAVSRRAPNGNSSGRHSLTGWACRASMSRLTAASFSSCRTNRSPSLAT